MTIKSIALSLLLTTFLSGSAFSQIHFVPGFVVMNSGDTLRGFINDQEWNINPSLIQFKKSEGEIVMMLTPLMIQSFSIENGNRYFSFSDSIESSSLRPADLSEIRTPEKIRDTVFVRALILGKASLFYLKDRNERDHFLIQNSTGNITELYYKKYKYNDNVGDFTGEIPGYKGQLSQLLVECGAFAPTMTNRSLQYSEKDLSSIIIDFNNCSGGHISYTEPRAKWKFNFSVEAGINISKLLFKSNGTGVTYGYETGYAAGVSLDAIIPRNRSKWSIYNDMLVRNFKSTHSNSNPPREVTLYVIYLKLASTIRYHFILEKVHPFVEFGFTNAFALKASDASHLVNGGFRKYEQGLVGGVGTTYRAFSLQSMLELSNGMSQIQGLRTTYHTLYLQAGYIF